MNKKSNKAEDNIFKQCCDAHIVLKANYKTGLQAIKGEHRKMIQTSDSKKIQGSVDVDKAYMSLQPHACRWDYAIGYDDRTYYVEVHPASTGEVDLMIKKFRWLMDLIKGSPLESISQLPVYWVPSGRVDIANNQSVKRKLAQMGIVIRPVVKI